MSDIAEGPAAPLLLRACAAILADGRHRSTGEMLAALSDGGVVTTGKHLLWYATHDLAAYARRGEPVQRRRRMGKGWITRTERPWIWGLYDGPNDEAKGIKTCPHCGGKL